MGDDANPCSRTAPCKTWAGAIPKTAPGGEIDALDPGGFGSVTITKSITLNGTGTNASVTGAGGLNGITVNGVGGIHVVINDLSLDGTDAGNNGVEVVNAASVRILNSDIEGWTRSAVADESSAATVVDVDNTAMSNNPGDGVVLAPGAGIAGSVTLSNDAISGDACGVVATAFGVPSTPSLATNCGANTTGTGAGALKVSTANSSISNNAGIGVLANGSVATDYISQDAITGNGTGLEELAGGQIIAVGTNTVLGNGFNGSPTSTQSSTAAAADVVIRCGAQTCTGKLIRAADAKVKKHGRRTHATLSRAGKVYAVGTITLSSNGGAGVLSPRGHLKAGRYRLMLRRNGRVVGERTVVFK